MSCAICDSDEKIFSTSSSHLTNIILRKMPVSSSLQSRDIGIDLNTILSRSITPATSIAGIFLIISGLFLALVGARNQKMQVFLSTTYLAGLGIAILVLHLAEPPISPAIQGAYFVAAFVPALVLGSLASLLRNALGNLASAAGGFCLAMFIMTLRDGGLLTSVASKTTFVICLTAGVFAMSFNRYTHAYVLVASTSLTGASAIILGIDCFSLTGLKEFWVYIWALNSRLFSESQNTYTITRKMGVEMAGIILLAILGTISQTQLWKIVMQHRRHGNIVTHLEEQQRDDIESGHTTSMKETPSYQVQETDQHYSNNKMTSETAAGTFDENKSSLHASTTDKLDPMTVEAVLTPYSEPMAAFNLDDAITPSDSVEQIALSTPDSVRATSSSTTLVGADESHDEPLSDFGKNAIIPHTKQAIQEQRDKRCITASHRTKSRLSLRQLRPSKTFMDIVAAKLKQLSQASRSSIRVITEHNTSQQRVSYLTNSVQGSQFDALSVDEAQISRPLLEQESAEQFVSSILGDPPVSAELDKPGMAVEELREHRSKDGPAKETGSVTTSTGRSPTRHGHVLPIPRSSEDEKFESQTQPLLGMRGTEGVNPYQTAIPNAKNSTLADIGTPLDSLPKTEHSLLMERTQLPQDMIQGCDIKRVERPKPIAKAHLHVFSSYVPASTKLPAVIGNTPPAEPSNSFSILESGPQKSRTTRMEAQKLSRTCTITSSHVNNVGARKAISPPATMLLSSRSNLRSSVGSWPRHNDTKHSLQRRLQSSLRNSRSCVLNSPIDEDEVTSFSFCPSTTCTDIPRRASYPYHSRTGLDTGDSIKYTSSQLPTGSTCHRSFIDDGLRADVFSSTKKQHSRPNSEEPTFSRQRQAYLEGLRLESRAQDQKYLSRKVHPQDRKTEQSKIPQHTLYRASMLATWRRSNPLESRRLTKTLTSSPSNILRDPV